LNNRITPGTVWEEYLRADGYNRAIGLYDNVRKNEDFYIGDQWKGVHAPDLEKPVLNFLKRVVAYFIATIVSDDVAVSLTPARRTDDNAFTSDVLTGEIDHVIETTKAKTFARDMLRNCAVDGDGCFYFHFLPKGGADGEIKLENLDNTKVLFGNPYDKEVQDQPYLLLVCRRSAEEVRAEAKANRSPDWASIGPDTRSQYMNEDYDAENDLCTELVRLWKEDGTVRFCRTTRDCFVHPPAETGLSLYPVAWMNWEPVKNSYHGRASLTGLIPNQIFVNKLWAMAMEHQKRLAFPKLFYDMTKIHEWTNKVGQAIGVAGDPNTAIASSFRAADMSNQVLKLVERTIAYSRDFLGASDAVLGNVRPENTSAIIAVQEAAAAPLELQRLSYYQFWEDSVRILLDLMRCRYGEREIVFDPGDGPASVFLDFGLVDYDGLGLKVDVGKANYWSELLQVQTADNLFRSGVLTDAVSYLESVPDKYIHNKNKLIAGLRERQAALLKEKGTADPEAAGR